MQHFGYGRGSLSKAAEDAIKKWIENEEHIEDLLAKVIGTAKDDKNVISVILFGSYGGGEPSYGDVDLALLLEEDNVKSPIFLGKFGDQKGLLDVSILNRLPMNIQSKILQEGKILYCPNQDKHYEYLIKLIKKWEDFSPRFERIIAERNLI